MTQLPTETASKIRQVPFGLVLACGAAIIALFSQRMACMSAAQMKPEVSFFWSLISLWIPVLTGFIVLVKREQYARRKAIILKVLALSICVAAFCVSASRKFAGWQTFVSKITRDVRPKDLSNGFVQKLVVSEKSGFHGGSVTSAELSIFGEGELVRIKPTLSIFQNGQQPQHRTATLMWGSDFQAWGIKYTDQESNGLKWQDKLYFVRLNK